MKLIVNLLNAIANHNATKHRLKTCLLAASLLITTPVYALDGEGWGAIIKGVTEVLHNNQQQEIKQREEQQKLEQQRLQEQQQLKQLAQQNLQQANNANGGQACNHKVGKWILKKWAGGCSNGYLYGDGELVLSLSSTNEIRKYVSKFSDGYWTGIILRHDLEKNGQTLPIDNQKLGYIENENEISIPVAVKINNRLQSYAYKDFDWYTVAADKTLDRKISFDEAMQIVKNFMATKTSDTMSYERFRAYLEGKLSFEPAQTQTAAQQISSSPSIEAASEATDEPPQKGIFLDRRKKATTKKKK